MGGAGGIRSDGVARARVVLLRAKRCVHRCWSAACPCVYVGVCVARAARRRLCELVLLPPHQLRRSVRIARTVRTHERAHDGRSAGAGLALAVIYAAGYVGERAALVWGKKIKLPALAGSLVVGLLLRNVPGPWRTLLAESPYAWLGAVRTVGTAVIILRAGMGLNLPKVMADARGIVALSLLPGLCEVVTVMLITRALLGVSWTWGLMAGFLHGAVSPAVIVPAAINLQEKSMGTRVGVPNRLLSGTLLVGLFCA